MTTTRREPVNPADMVRGEVIIVTDGTGTEVLRGKLVQTGLYDNPQLKVGDVLFTAHNGHYEREVKVLTAGERFRASPVGTTVTLGGKTRVRLPGDYYAFTSVEKDEPTFAALSKYLPAHWEGEPEDEATWSFPTKA